MAIVSKSILKLEAIMIARTTVNVRFKATVIRFIRNAAPKVKIWEKLLPSLNNWAWFHKEIESLKDYNLSSRKQEDAVPSTTTAKERTWCASLTNACRSPTAWTRLMAAATMDTRQRKDPTVSIAPKCATVIQLVLIHTLQMRLQVSIFKAASTVLFKAPTTNSATYRPASVLVDRAWSVSSVTLAQQATGGSRKSSIPKLWDVCVSCGLTSSSR